MIFFLWTNHMEKVPPESDREILGGRGQPKEVEYRWQTHTSTRSPTTTLMKDLRIFPHKTANTLKMIYVVEGELVRFFFLFLFRI
jgi:hypothetical protein